MSISALLRRATRAKARSRECNHLTDSPAVHDRKKLISIAMTIGCQTADNNMNVNANMTREKYERDKDTWAEEARRLGRAIGTGVNDGRLWTKTRALLSSENDFAEHHDQCRCRQWRDHTFRFSCHQRTEDDGRQDRARSRWGYKRAE